ncbi:hypothetical protein C453_09888 [Haloferax elongans ATCC BAA-1513]|uniref:SipW-cognate class signal peptide n=1 Tax=Haloferax elongans ATCC BAA-1513 TaxID=1230453 RepID=M0HSM9_HALEO|nr:SipW-dependent-type signal peptide-containing protein [Haloferax elongans]ELZ86119.1 hypothetical protein C453_09888 [Haloferax elongans ATCC BAA-1513]
MSSKDTIELSRRKVLGGLAVIGVASATAGAGTIAALNDTETSNGNSIYAGTLDLKIGSPGSFGDSNVTLLDAQGIVPGQSGSGMVHLKNDNSSSTGGAVDVRITDVNARENGRTEMEREAGDTDSDSELPEYLKVRMYFEDLATGDRTYLGDDVFRKASNRLQSGKTFAVHYPLTPSEKVKFVLEWQLPASAPSTIMTDTISVDFAFDMMQAVLGTSIDGGTNSYGDVSGNPRFDGFPAWTASDKAFDTKAVFGGSGDELRISGNPGGSYTWTGSPLSAPFTFTYDGATTTTINLGGSGGSTVTGTVPSTDSGIFALIAKSESGGTVEVSDVAINGIAAAPGMVTKTGDGSKGIEFDIGDFSGGVEVTGTIELSGTISAQETGLQIDVRDD